MRPTIYIIDEEPADYQYLQESFSELGASVTYCQSITQFISLQGLRRPACVISELQIGSEKGSSLLDFMESRCLTVPVIFYTTFMDVDVILDVMERGAVTVLNKALDSTKLLDYVSSAIETDRRQSELSEIYCNVRGILDRLTVRQRDILGFIVQGISTKMIADRFHVSQRLIEKERSEILRQFRVSATPDVTLMMGEYRAINDLWSHPRWRVTTHGWPVASRN